MVRKKVLILFVKKDEKVVNVVCWVGVELEIIKKCIIFEFVLLFFLV